MKKLFQKTLALSLMLLMSVSMWAVRYCDYPTGHDGNANFGDPNGRILATLVPTENANEYRLTIKPNVANGNTQKLDYLYVIAGGNSPYPATAGTDDNGDALDEMSVTFTNPNANTSFTIQWSTPNWNGRWQWNWNDVALSELEACSAGPDPGLDIPTDVESEYCYTIHTTNQPATKWATDMENGNVVITMYDAPGATNARFRNGGFEGGMNGFKVLSGANFATVENASEYFTREETSSTVFTLKRKASVTLPNPCKIRFQEEAFAWACNENNNAYTKPCVFEYTYGGQCTGIVDVTGITLNKSAISIEKGSTFDLVATVLPVYATNQNVTWETSAEGIATVADGVVSGVAAGSATITVKTVDGNFTASCAVIVTEKLSQCYGDLGHFATPQNARMHYEIEYNEGTVTFIATGINNPLDFAELQIIDVGNFAMTADGNGGYTWSRSGAAFGDKWYFRFLYSDTSFGGNEMTAENFAASDANMRYYVVGECLPPYKVVNEDYTTLSGVEATASSTRDNTPGAALVDNNTAWGSIWNTDPQWFMVDLGKECVFNSVAIKWAAHFASKYDVLYSRDGENFKTFADNQVGAANAETSVGGAPTIARYIKLQLKNRGAGYGYEIKKVAVKYVENSELTTLAASIDAKFLKAGQNYPIVLDARDQYGLTMAPGEVEYTITPAAAGTVTEGKFYAASDFHGAVTISAHVGEIVSENIVKTVVMGDNLALNNAMDGVGTYSENHGPARAVDGNDGTEWQGKPEGAEGNNYDAWFVVDLQNTYDIDLITIHFEGACSDAYHIDFSSDNVNWATGYNFAQNIGQSNHTDYISTFTNNIQVRYVRFWSTKASTGWGMKIFEFQVYGRVNESASLHNVAAVASPAEGGVVAVKQNDVAVSKADEGSIVNFIATANPHFQFTQWSDGSMANPYPVTVTEDVTLTATFSRTEYAVSVATADAAKGSAAASVAGAVAINGAVTFTATAEEGYAFVNWTDENDAEVSTDATFVVEHANRDYNLTANFDYRRDVYCHHAVTTTGDYKVYLTLGQTATEGQYMFLVEGSSELQITGINNANTAINGVSNGVQSGQDVPFTKANGGWTFNTSGYGSATCLFTIAPGKTWKDIDIWRPDLFLETNHGEQNINNKMPNRYHIDWTASCSDDEAPVLAAPMATALNTTDIRLTMSATDNWEGMITYFISRAGAEDIVLTNNASGETVTYDVTGLVSDATYTFSIVATDAAGNACVAKNCSATLSAAGDVTAPTGVTVSAKPLTDTSVELSLFANDDYDGDITYTITYAGGKQNTSATRGTKKKITIEGLSASTAYTFSVVAADAAGNEATAVVANATTFSGNLALNKECVAGGEAYPAVRANNNNLGDRWASGGGDMAKNWWAVNLGGVYDVKNIRISFEDACPTNYDLMASYDGENYTLIQNYATEPNHANNGAGGWNDYPVNAQARWLKIVAHTATFNNAYGVSIWEFQAYGTPAVDAVAPVVTSFTANGTSQSTIELHAQATDNFCGALTYIFYNNAEEEIGRVENVAYGTQADYTATGLTSGSHTFKVKAFDGTNYSEFESVTAETVTDTQAPEDLTVTVTEVTPYTIAIEMSATDDKGGAITYAITWNGGAAEVSAASGATVNYTIEGLTYATEYTISVVAKDGSDNASAPVVKTQSTLRADFPTEAAVEPAFREQLVCPVYSAKYGKTNCNWELNSWGNNASRVDDTYGQKINFNTAGYIGITNFSYPLNEDDHIYMQIWSNVDNTIDVYPIARNEANTANCPEKYITVSLVGGQWNTINLRMGDFDLAYLGNIYQIKIANAQNQILWLNNILFYRPLTATTEVAGFAAGMGTICIPQGAIPAPGTTFYELAYKEEQNGLLYKVHFDQVDRLEPGHAYIYEAETSPIELVYTFETPAAAPVAVNGLIGTFDGINLDLAETVENELTGKYIVYENKIRLCGNGCGLRANRAYIDPAAVRGDVVAPAPGRRRISLRTQDSQVATGFENLNGETMHSEPMKVLINGQVFILRGAKMYNTQGQLVK